MGRRGQRNKVMKYGEGPQRVRCPWVPNVIAMPLLAAAQKQTQAGQGEDVLGVL